MGNLSAIFIVLLGMVNGLAALSCLQCGTYTCPTLPRCPADVVKEPCNCCDVCAHIEGQSCGGPFGISGTCSSGLTCEVDPRDPLGFQATGTCACPAHSSWTLCGSACPASCDTLDSNIICPAVCVPGCQCDPGYVLNDGSCIPMDQCGTPVPTEEPTCPPYSEWSLCGAGCQRTCDVLLRPCLAVCIAGCVCTDGYVRDGDDCVPVDQCGICDYGGNRYNDGDEWAVQDSPGLNCRCNRSVVTCETVDCTPGHQRVIGRDGLWTLEQQTLCPSGYLGPRGNQRTCYKAFTDRKSYQDAEDQCSEDCAQLVTIKGKKTNNMLKRGLARLGARSDVWIGLSDRDEEGKLVWSSGEEYRKTKRTNFWAKGGLRQNTDDKDCVFMSWADKYRWRIGSCADHRPFICEFVLG